MKKYFVIFLIGMLLFSLTIKGVMKLEKLNFFAEPYFIICFLGLILMIISLVALLILCIVNLIFYLTNNK